MYVLRGEGATILRVDGPQSPEFIAWLKADREARVKAVGYFVACAFDAGTLVKLEFDDGAVNYNYKWSGQFGLATGMQKALPGRLTDANKKAVNLPLPTEEGKWVSACLMAYANMAGSHEFISLRGNPPAWAETPPSFAEQWTFGYPEGVFFADLLNFNVVDTNRGPQTLPEPLPPTKQQLEQSFTLSLNLPNGYPGLDAAKWAPPNGSNGRKLDYASTTKFNLTNIGWYRVAEKLGTFLEQQGLFGHDGVLSDPFYKKNLVCVRSGLVNTNGTLLSGPPEAVLSSGAQQTNTLPIPPVQVGNLELPRHVVSCDTSGAVALRPLFVHAPLVAGLAAASKTVNSALVIQVLDTGNAPLTSEQRSPCSAGVDCTGPFVPTLEGVAPTAPPQSQLAAHTLVKLGEKQSVTAVLRGPTLKGRDLLDAVKEPFTAIVRYRTWTNSVAPVRVSGPGGAMVPVGQEWPAPQEIGHHGWRWMQIYPVYAAPDSASGGRLALKVVISGPAGAGTAPELDLAGFISGPPTCSGDDGAPFMKVCPDSGAGLVKLRRGAQALVPRLEMPTAAPAPH
jgi:hypothetical protein